MPGLSLGLSPFMKPINWAAYWAARLDTWHKIVSDNDFNESAVSLDAKFLPAVGTFNGTDDIIDTGYNLTGATDFDITMIVYRSAAGTIQAATQGTGNTGRAGFLWYSDNNIYCFASNSGTQNGSVAFNVTGWHTLRVVYNGGGATDADRLKFYGDGVEKTLSYSTTIPATIGTIAATLFIGRGYASGFVRSVGFKSYFSVSKNGATASKYYITGHQSYEYDVSGNGNHGTWYGTGDRRGYDLEGSLYPAQDGYSLWKKGGSLDVQVPYDVSGDALVLTPGTNIPTGYAKTANIEGNSTKWNMAEALVDFDPDAGTDAKVDTFDKSNSTIHIATGSMSYYDGSYPYRWRIDEIADPLIYITYFNVGYKGRIYAKVEIDDLDQIVRYDEQLNCTVDQTGDADSRALVYCNIDEYLI